VYYEPLCFNKRHVSQLVPTLFRHLVLTLDEHGELSHVRRVWLGGEVITPTDVEQSRLRMPNAPASKSCSGYLRGVVQMKRTAVRWLRAHLSQFGATGDHATARCDSPQLRVIN
jgi:hypothetical protein